MNCRENTGKLESSGQYTFSNKKMKLGLSISVRKVEKFEFYSKEFTDFDFLNKFYIWETEYWSKEGGVKVEIEKIEVNETEKYVIWRLKIIDNSIDHYILSGVRNNKLIGINLYDTNKNEPKSRVEQIEFLKKMYLKK